MLRFYSLLASLALFAAPAAAQSVNDFKLPPSTATPAPRAQGPIDEESGAIPSAPRVVSTAAPRVVSTAAPRPAASTAPTQPAPQTTPSAAPTTATRTGAPAQPRATVQPTTRVTSTPGATPPPPVEGADVPTGAFDPSIPAPDAATAATAPTYVPPFSGPSAATPASAEADGDFPWLYAALAVLGALALGAAALWLRARRAARPPAAIERPVLARATAPALPLSEALQLRAEVLKVTRSFAFVTTDYRLTLVNRTGAALAGFEVGADMISAHSGAPMESQLAGPATVIETRHSVERLGPNQTLRLEGQVRMPLGDAQVIRQGRTPLLVPLLRVRAARPDGAAGEALVKTLVVGQGTQDGGRVQPFNLADAPRAYTAVAQRELA